MRQVTHRFDTVAEARAFVEGVEWVNDSAIEYQGDLDDGRSALFTDEDDAEDAVFDHRGGAGETDYANPRADDFDPKAAQEAGF